MTTAERIIAHFAKTAPPCRKHKAPLRLSNEGGWFIECDKGCMMNDDDDRESPTALLMRFERDGI